MVAIETDYLIIGAGAAGMAFADALIAESDADVVMVDRRNRPGGHWNDAYPFVQLHQPSAFYGVNSRTLGTDAIDEFGANAGMYHRATSGEICDYFGRVLDEHFLPSGQVRFFGMSDYASEPAGAHRFVSRLTGKETTVKVRRKVVDATYLETPIPSTHTPSFEVDPDAHFIPINDLVARVCTLTSSKSRVEHAPERAGDIKHSQSSIDRIRTALAFEPSVGLDEGLRRTIVATPTSR